MSLGRPETSGQVHLDLEAEAVLAITGEPTACSDLLRLLTLDLARSTFGPISVVAVTKSWLARENEMGPGDLSTLGPGSASYLELRLLTVAEHRGLTRDSPERRLCRLERARNGIPSIR